MLANVSSRRMAGFRFSGRLATLTWCNEADSGSLALRLTGSLHGAPTRRLLPALSASLHAGRSLRMMNTFQFISSFGGAGAPEGTEVLNKEIREVVIISAISARNMGPSPLKDVFGGTPNTTRGDAYAPRKPAP